MNSVDSLKWATLMISSQVILYEMLVGQPPFLANTPAETQYKVDVMILIVDDVIFILITITFR